MAEENQKTAEFELAGVLEGHDGWVTSIVSGFSQKENEDSSVLVSGSRDHSLIIWRLFEQEQNGLAGTPHRALTGHNNFISSLSLSNDNCFCISSSWDKSLRLWDLRAGKTSRRFVGHTKEVFTAAFSPDNRQILSAGADREIKLWNTIAECKFTSDKNNHSDWVSQVAYSPIVKSSTKAQPFAPYFASVGWDGRLKIWNTNFQIRFTFKAHESNINGISISPNGKYLATGGKDKKLQIWDIMDFSHNTKDFDAGATINQIAFNPKMQWVAAGTENSVKIWDLGAAGNKPIATLTAEPKKGDKQKQTKAPACTSLTWNALGKKLFAGFSDGNIRVYNVNTQDK